MIATTTQELQVWLDRLRGGDPQARDALITVACERLTVLTRKMFHEYQRLWPWVQTDDVFQNATIRLHRSLAQISPPSVRDFYGLAAAQIRRELRDLVRHYYGRAGAATAEAGPDKLPDHSPVRSTGLGKAAGGDSRPPEADGCASTHDPQRLAAWAEFHEAVENLPPDERDVVDLLWYQDLTQEAAAELLGVDPSTVKRRWRAVRVKLQRLLRHWLPGA
jgi:RNA polymerase sigma factor (sigma-70 family)